VRRKWRFKFEALRRPIDGELRVISELIELSTVIGDIYEAAMDSARWPAALASVSAYVGGSPAQGVVDVLIVTLEQNPTRSCLIDNLTDIASTSDMRQRLALLIPHLQRAVARGRLIDGHPLAAPAQPRGVIAADVPLDVIAQRYRLTQSEMRVFETMLRVTGIKAIAEAVGLSQATVKTHLHNLFRKTGRNRQKDLVKLAAGL
jgi:DNA-binding CsgD family transcriptional regulator